MYDTLNPKDMKILHYEVSGEKSLPELLENFKKFLLACDFDLGDDVRIGLIDTKAEEIEIKLNAIKFKHYLSSDVNPEYMST